MDFGLSEEIDEIRETVRRWVDEKLVPRAYEINYSNEFPTDLWTKLGALDRVYEVLAL